jgi:uracil-DNA glycosylase
MTRCSICPCVKGRNPILPSIPLDLPTPCPVLFIGEAGAKTEDLEGTPFCGATGTELNLQYLPIAGLTRLQVPVCNAVYCSQPTYRNPKPEEAAICSGRHLMPLLERLEPQVIVTMGAVAASLFPGINLNLHHGIPQKGRYGSWEGIVYPSYHPAAGLRSTAYMIPLRKDFENLGKLLRELWEGTFEWPQDPYQNRFSSPDYKVIRTFPDFCHYVKDDYFDIALDTEYGSYGAHCLTFSHTPGTGRLIYASNSEMLQELIKYLQVFNPLFHLHNGLADFNPLASMGITIPPRRFLDTMIRAYEMGLGGGGDEDDSGGRGSLGLKSLAYRYLHMEMQSFDDLVTPYAIPLVIDWLDKVAKLSAPGEPEIVCGNCGCPQNMHTQRGKSKRFTGHCIRCSPHMNLFEPFINDSTTICPRFKKVVRHNVRTTAGGQELNRLHNKVKALVKKLETEMWVKVEKPTDPWRRLSEWHDWEQGWMSEVMGGAGEGEMPVKDVRLVPEPELVKYACRDADATIRMAYFLNRLKS